MNTIKKTIRMNKLYISILFIITFISCSNNELLYKIIVYEPQRKDNLYDQSPIIIPIKNNKDSVYYCTSPSLFYNKVGIFLFTETEFSKKLYNKITRHDYINVSDSIFLEIKKENNIITEDKEVLDIYKKQGILEVLKKYTNEHGEISYKNTSFDRVNYIYYLAFINDIYFFWDDEGGPGYFLDNSIIEQIKSNNESALKSGLIY